MRYPTLYFRMLVLLRLVVPAVRRAPCGKLVRDHKTLGRLEEFESSGFYRVGTPRYFY